MSHRCPLDRVIRGTFEWREVANLLASFGVKQPGWERGVQHAPVVSEAAYRTANALAHRDAAFVARLRSLLSKIHARRCAEVRRMTLPQLGRVVSHDFQPDETDWLWAMLSDRREEVVAMAKVWVRESVG